MAHDRDTAFDDAVHRFGHILAAFQLDRLRSTLLEDAARVADGLGDVGMVAHEGQVADDVGLLGAPHDGLDMVEHVIHSHRNRGVISQHHHSQAVSDQHQGDSGLLQQLGRRVIVGRHHGDFLAPNLHVLEVSNGHTHVWYLLAGATE